MTSTPKFCQSCGVKNESHMWFCYACGSALPTLPSLPSPAKKRTLAPVLFGVGSLSALLVIGIFLIDRIQVNRPASRASPSPTADLALVPMATPVVHSAPPSAWSYNSDVDDMSGKKYHTATVESSNVVSFDFPYQGAQRGRLTLRKHPRWGNNVILEIEKGQFMAGVTGVRVIARFDDGAPMKFWALGPEDYGTTTLFISNYARFVAQLRKAKTVRISTPIYHEGEPVFEFNVAGLEGF